MRPSPPAVAAPRRSSPRAIVARAALAALTLACGDAVPRAELPPTASFLAVAGDSTFWIESSAGRVRVRRSPILLTEVQGNFLELYVAEDDRSFFDALIVGQRIYRRDLVTGDSAVLLEDTTLSAIADAYATTHPRQSPLGPDEEGSADPATRATTETELLDALGPFLTYEQHLDIEIAGGRDDHSTRRGVLDVRDGRLLSVRDLAGAAIGGEVEAQGRRLLAAAVDSIKGARDVRARRAQDVLAGFVFDSLSFALVNDGGEPAVEFLVPGRGEGAGGYSLSLTPVRIPAGPWWQELRTVLPVASSPAPRWSGGTYDVVALEDSSGERATMTIRQRRGEWKVARLPLPVRRVHRLDGAPAGSPQLRALSRAFDESSLYSGEARTARAITPRGARQVAVRAPGMRLVSSARLIPPLPRP